MQFPSANDVSWLQGAGKTTTTAKLAKYLEKNTKEESYDGESRCL